MNSESEHEARAPSILRLLRRAATTPRVRRWAYNLELQSKWARMLFYGPLVGGVMIPITVMSMMAGAWVPAIAASLGSGIYAGLWKASARRYKEYALNPYCPDCRRDLVDCLPDKMFTWSKCKAEMEVEADE